MSIVNIKFPGNLAQVSDLDSLRAVASGLVTAGDLFIVLAAGGVYQFDTGSTAADNGATVIRPNDRTPLQAGRWLYSVDGFAPGPAGAAANTRTTLAQLKAANVADITSLYNNFVWTWTTGNFSSRSTDPAVVKSDFYPITVGAWIQQPVIATVSQGQQDLTIFPRGNATIGTSASSFFDVIFPATSPNARSFGRIATALTQSGGSGANNGHVLDYADITALEGTGAFWLKNWLVSHKTNAAVDGQLLEADYNMENTTKFGTLPGPAGLVGGTYANGSTFTTGAVKGIVGTGVSLGGTMTTMFLAAAALDPVTPKLLYQRGFTNAVGSVQTGFEDTSSSITAFGAKGINTDGFSSAEGSFSGAAFLMGNLQSLQSRGTDGVTRLNLLRALGGSLQLGHKDGGAGVAEITIATSMRPHAANSQTLGTQAAPFGGGWFNQYSIAGILRTLSVDSNGFVKAA